MINFVPTPESLNHIDWPQFKNIITKHIYFDHTCLLFEKMFFFRNQKDIKNDLTTLDMLNNVRDDYFSKISTLFHYFPQNSPKFDFLKSLKKEYVLDLHELNIAVNLLEIHLELSHFSLFTLLKTSPSFETYFNDLNFSNELKNFIKEFRKYVSKEGERSFNNHPELSALIKEQYHIENDIRKELTEVINELSSLGVLQFKEHDIIYDRFVIALRSDSYQSKYGNIISKSASGQTLYVEPPATRQMSNRRMEILSRIDEIIYKITKAYSSILTKYFIPLEKSFELLGQLDLVMAKLSLIEQFGLTRQTINDNQTLEISNFYHPLIDNCVKNSLTLSETTPGLIISGPNTGGKSVTLKSIAIILTFHHLGIYVPASYANIPHVDAIHYFSNDGQNLSQGLSSFSSEIKVLINLLKNIKPNSYLFIDEILNTTSSEEASAIALTFLDELKHIKGVKIFISTHHQFLKTLVHQKNDFLSAHVGFNDIEERPNFKIYYGNPGSSMALTIFKQLSEKENLSSSLYQKASKLLGEKQILYEQLLAKISAKNAELDVLIKSNKELNHQLQNQKKSMEGQLFIQKQNLIHKAQSDVNDIIKKARTIFEQSIETKKQFEKKAYEAKKELYDFQNKELPQENNHTINENTLIPFSHLKINQSYYSNGLKKEIKIMELDNKKKLVKFVVSGKTMIMPIDKLLLETNYNHHKTPKFVFNYSKIDEGLIEVDCRGMRLDEFIKISEDSLEQIILEKIPFVTIIHGHGDGILKKWLRDHLQKEHHFIWDTPDGNDGCTRIKLR